MERKHVPIQKAYLLSCVNARFEDLHEAAEVVRTAADAWPPASNFIWPRQARKCRPSPSPTVIGTRWWRRAPFRCRPVAEHASAWVAVWWAKAKSRSAPRIAISRAAWAIRDAQVYLGSPAVVAASALAGFICAPQTFTDRAAGTAIRRAPRQTAFGRFGRDHRRLSTKRARPRSFRRQGQFEHRRHLRRQAYLPRRSSRRSRWRR